MTKVLGIIGGSGIYEISDIEHGQWINIESPFGSPSDELFIGEVDGLKIVFLPRHGRDHTHSPSSINYRANIDALKRVGVTDIISIGACGSLRNEIAPGDFVLVNQFIDRTVSREKTFFNDGAVAHVSVAKPTCTKLGEIVLKASQCLDVKMHNGGTYLAMEGPQFSTLAESNIYRSWRCDIIGMTGMPEAKLAREAEICYVTVSMVTDFDSWHPEHGEVDVKKIVKVLGENSLNGFNLIKKIIPLLKSSLNRHPCIQGCDKALENAYLTRGDLSISNKEKLSAVAARILSR